MKEPQTPAGTFLAEHRQTQRMAAAGSGLHLSQINALVRGSVRSRTDTVNAFLAYCKKFDPDVTYEQFFGPIPPAEVAEDPSQIALFEAGGRAS